MSIGLPRELPLEVLALRLEKVALTAAELADARSQVNTRPSDSQKAAGNYQKGHVTWQGLPIAIENPKGSTRSGKDKSGKPWSTKMRNDYGYFKGYKGKDKDHVDVFLGPDLESKRVYVVNQVDPTTGRFDEHKVIVGCRNSDAARATYLANYAPAWRGFGSIRAFQLAAFKNWLETGNLKKKAEDSHGQGQDSERPDDDHLAAVGDDRGGLSATVGRPIKIPLPKVRQSRNYTCGDAALESINEEFGTHSKGELEIAEDAGATREGGTPPDSLAEEARGLGLEADVFKDMTVEEIKLCLDNDRPVIVAIQAWGDPEKYDELDDGHYVVAIGYDAEKLYFMDPSIEGEWGELSYAEFEQRWIDREADGQVDRRLGIVIGQPGKNVPDEPLSQSEKIGFEIRTLGQPLQPLDPRQAFNEDMQRMANTLYKIRRAQARWRRRRAGGRRKRGSDICSVCKEPWSTCLGRHGSKPCACGSGKPRNKCDCPGGTPEKQAATGIPDRRNYGDLAKLQAGALLDLVIQKHNAQRAGEHFDVRMGSPELGLYSWATRKGLPEPGGKHALFQQPLHQHSYGDFQGTLSGYGSGTVRRERKGQVLITGASPDKITFTTADERHPQRYALVKPKGRKDTDWLLINTTPTEAVPYQKVHMIKVPKEQVEQTISAMQEGDSAQAKIDGASSLIKLLKDGVEVLSYRSSTQTGRPIVHTERVFGGRPKMQIPPELVGTVLKGELYGVQNVPAAGQHPGDAAVGGGASGDEQAATGAIHPAVGPMAGGLTGAAANPRPRSFGTNNVIGPQELGGLLNSTLAESIRKQREQNITLRVMLHGVQQAGRVPVSHMEVPYAERTSLLRTALAHLPQDIFHLPEEATTPDATRALWQGVSQGTNPLSKEGIVIHPAKGKPKKVKMTEDQDVHITGVFPGEGKYQGIGAGGFEYATSPRGARVGRVGTGLTDEFRRDLSANPNHYIGRVARVRSQGPFESGALRAPSFIALHEDYPTKLGCDLAALEDLGIVKQADDQTEKTPTVAVDLDGTLLEQMVPFDPNKFGAPRPGAKKWLQKFRDAGARIVIFTVRGKKKQVEAVLEEHGLPYDYINENPDQPADSSGKVIADVYWDDRAVSAKGRLSSSGPEVLERLKAADDGPVLIYNNPADVLEVITLMQEAA